MSKPPDDSLGKNKMVNKVWPSGWKSKIKIQIWLDLGSATSIFRNLFIGSDTLFVMVLLNYLIVQIFIFSGFFIFRYLFFPGSLQLHMLQILCKLEIPLTYDLNSVMSLHSILFKSDFVQSIYCIHFFLPQNNT